MMHGRDAVDVFHGRSVETAEHAFFEGAWNGEFASFGFADATVVAGSGAALTTNGIRFVASTEQYAPLFSVANGGSLHVSNSPAFAVAAAGAATDDIYPFYAYDLLAIYRRGLHGPDGRLPLRAGLALGVHFATIISVDRGGTLRFAAHRLGDLPRDYSSYAAMLHDGVRHVFDNAADSRRRQAFTPLASMSRGYDSTATAVLSAAAGCREAFSFTDSRGEDPDRDNGAANARALGFAHHTRDRWDYIGRDDLPEREFGYAPTSSNVPMTALGECLAHRIVVGGTFGDSVWDIEHAAVFEKFTRPWIRFTSGLGQIESRLRAGYVNLLPASIAARHNRAIQEISGSDEMRPWSIGGNYDRPIPRRICEERGLARHAFGMRKAATSHSHLNDPGRFSARGLADYLAFVREAHAPIPRLRYRYWRARADVLHRFWDRFGTETRRYVRTSAWQRRFPFILNTTPIRLPWDYMFTFQWTVASMRDRYALPHG
jgi:hypothetical protein